MNVFSFLKSTHGNFKYIRAQFIVDCFEKQTLIDPAEANDNGTAKYLMEIDQSMCAKTRVCGISRFMERQRSTETGTRPLCTTAVGNRLKIAESKRLTLASSERGRINAERARINPRWRYVRGARNDYYRNYMKRRREKQKTRERMTTFYGRPITLQRQQFIQHRSSYYRRFAMDGGRLSLALTAGFNRACTRAWIKKKNALRRLEILQTARLRNKICRTRNLSAQKLTLAKARLSRV